MSQNSNVEHPTHYNNKRGIECIDAMIAAFGKSEAVTFCKINAFKYLWRAENKGKYKEDMEKAAWYINKANELLAVEVSNID